jgi:hypothetical protein
MSDFDYGFVQVEVTTEEERLRGEQSFVNGPPRAVRLVGGPRDGEVVDSGAVDYAEVTAHGEVNRTAIWAPKRSADG